MKHFLKVLTAVILSVGPILIKEVLAKRWLPDPLPGWGEAAAWGTLIFIAALSNWILLKPDDRFLRVRDPSLTALFENLLKAKSIHNDVRVTIYVKHGWWVLSRLEPAFTYGYRTADKDYGKAWKYKRGLCWAVYHSGGYAICNSSDEPSSFRTSDADKLVTSHVKSVFCLPVRVKAKSGANRDPKVIAVLAFDAITESGSHFIRGKHDAMSNPANEMVDLVDYVGIYFE